MAGNTYELTEDDIENVRDRVLERALGRFLLTWPLVEHNVELLIWDLLELKPIEGTKITSRMDISSRCTLLSVIAKQRVQDNQLLAAIIKNTQQIVAILPARNDMVHGLWFREKKTRDVFVGSLRREKNEQILPRLITTRFVLANLHDAILIAENLKSFQNALHLRRLDAREPTSTDH